MAHRSPSHAQARRAGRGCAIASLASGRGRWRRTVRRASWRPLGRRTCRSASTPTPENRRNICYRSVALQETKRARNSVQMERKRKRSESDWRNERRWGGNRCTWGLYSLHHSDRGALPPSGGRAARRAARKSAGTLILLLRRIQVPPSVHPNQLINTLSKEAPERRSPHQASSASSFPQQGFWFPEVGRMY